jgi:prepilin-type N-terminal cleavage/methylation domain-containing protein
MNTLNKYCSKKQKGFTLVELAVVLGIVSVLAIGSVTLFKGQKVNVEQESAAGKLETVKIALLRFAEQNHYLPCPDASATGTESRILQIADFAAVPATFGRLAQAATATTPFIPAVSAIPAQPAKTVSVDICAVNSGTVPFEMIGLSLADVTDSNHNLFHYAVNQGVTIASNMANCPVNSACFFNRNSSPAFDYTTEPVAGRLGANNLRVCSDSSCSGADLLSDGLIAVLLAYNKNASAGVSIEEQENLDGDKTFIKAQYKGEESSAYFDDRLVSISGSELKRGDMKTYQKNSMAGAGTSIPPSQALLDIDDLGAGSSGTNIGTDEAFWDRVSQTFDFGTAAANQKVVLTYNTYVVGAWDQPETTGSNVTSDQGTVSSNNTQVKLYDHKVDNFEGVVQVSFVAGSIDPDVTGETYTLIDTYNASGQVEEMEVTEGVTYETYQPYWNDSAEIILTTDANGLIDLEFAVGTTATVETIDFTDIELVYYDTPPPIPDFPSVAPISGITQTEGL